MPLDPAEYIGKTILIGANYLDENDEVIERRQLFGTIDRFEEGQGIVVKLNRSDEEFTLPPYLGALEKAEPGDYTLTATLEIVTDPDFLTVWSFRKSSVEG